jgi:hypothetical protein
MDGTAGRENTSQKRAEARRLRSSHTAWPKTTSPTARITASRIMSARMEAPAWGATLKQPHCTDSRAWR